MIKVFYDCTPDGVCLYKCTEKDCRVGSFYCRYKCKHCYGGGVMKILHSKDRVLNLNQYWLYCSAINNKSYPVRRCLYLLTNRIKYLKEKSLYGIKLLIYKCNLSDNYPPKPL